MILCVLVDFFSSSNISPKAQENAINNMNLYHDWHHENAPVTQSVIYCFGHERERGGGEGGY